MMIDARDDAWFPLARLTAVASDGMPLHGLRLITNGGRVRDVWDDGTYYDRAEGRQIAIPDRPIIAELIREGSHGR